MKEAGYGIEMDTDRDGGWMGRAAALVVTI